MTTCHLFFRKRNGTVCARALCGLSEEAMPLSSEAHEVVCTNIAYRHNLLPGEQWCRECLQKAYFQGVRMPPGTGLEEEDEDA